MAILLFILFVLYTIACCMDGPDLKPRWKRWLGMKLEGYADNLKPIDYCVRDRCKFYRATYDFPMVQKQYEELLGNIAQMNALNSKPTVFIYDFKAVPIENEVMLSENDIYESRMYQDMMRQHGIPDWQIPRHKNLSVMIEEAKQKCIHSLLNDAKQFACVEVDKESHYPAIIIRGRIYVGKECGVR